MGTHLAKASFLGAAVAAVVCACGGPAESAEGPRGPEAKDPSDDATLIAQCGAGRRAAGRTPEECAALLTRLDQRCAAARPDARSKYCLGAMHLRAAEAVLQCTDDIDDIQKGRPTTGDVSVDCNSAVTTIQASCAQTQDPEECAVAKETKALLKVLPLLHQVRAARSCGQQSILECQSACDSGDLESCVEIGNMYMQGSRVARDMAKGSGILLSACGKGAMRACYMHGAGNMVLDPKAAAASLTIVCGAKDDAFQRTSCGLLVAMIDKGMAAPARTDRIALFRRICGWEKANPGSPGSIGACGRLKDLGEE